VQLVEATSGIFCDSVVLLLMVRKETNNTNTRNEEPEKGKLKKMRAESKEFMSLQETLPEQEQDLVEEMKVENRT
jgi:hypothetical protein